MSTAELSVGEQMALSHQNQQVKSQINLPWPPFFIFNILIMELLLHKTMRHEFIWSCNCLKKEERAGWGLKDPWSFLQSLLPSTVPHPFTDGPLRPCCIISTQLLIMAILPLPQSHRCCPYSLCGHTYYHLDWNLSLHTPANKPTTRAAVECWGLPWWDALMRYPPTPSIAPLSISSSWWETKYSQIKLLLSYVITLMPIPKLFILKSNK